MAVLTGKAAIVTGAGRGIGREIALDMARHGASVVVNDLGGNADGTGSGKVADDVVKEIQAGGGKAAASYDSVGRIEGAKRIFRPGLDASGACDILVNKAGILRDKTIFSLDEQDWDSVLDGPLRGTSAARSPSRATSARPTGAAAGSSAS